ncbi:penicillin acylase family protein [Vibrio vulnificus]
MLKITKVLFLVFIFVLIAVVGGGWSLLKLSSAKLDGNVQTATLAEDVTIYRDQNGVPDIQAADKESAMFALGFLHSQDRFFQMDLLRRSASGELAELIGKSGLKLDRQRRLWRLRKQAKQQLGSLDAGQRSILQSYVEGVNAGLNALRSRPFEYWLLGTQPEKWKAEDSLLVIAAMYFDLQGNQPGREYMRGWIKNNTTAEQMNFLLPTASDWDVPLKGAIPKLSAIPDSPPEWWAKSKPIQAADFIDENMKGSNAWLVQKDGQAYLANDMHLGLSLPAVWYKAQWRYPSGRTIPHQMTGITLPGIPAMISGSNGAVAWGFTNSYIDAFEWVRLPDPAGPITEYREILNVKGAKPEELVVRESRWGPVVSTDIGVMAMRWSIKLPGSLNIGLGELELADTVFEAVSLVQRAGIPVQNFLVADSAGNIAWTLAGVLLDRTMSGQSHSFPVTADQDRAVWNNLPLALDSYPIVINPNSGSIVSANNRLLFNRQGEVFGDGGADMGVRATAISTRLAQLSEVSAETLYQVQLDNTALLAQSWREMLLESLNGVETIDSARMATILTEWDGMADKDSVAYAWLSVWRNQLYHTLFASLDDMLSQQWPDALYRRANPRWDSTVQRLMRENDWVPDGYDSWDALILELLIQSWQEVENGTITWGALNKSQLKHPLANAVPVLGKWLMAPEMPLSGDNNVIHVNRSRFGASERLVVSPGHEERAFLSIPSGQSGHPLSRWWLNEFERWDQGRPTALQPSSSEYQLVLQGTEVGAQ